MLDLRPHILLSRERCFAFKGNGSHDLEYYRARTKVGDAPSSPALLHQKSNLSRAVWRNGLPSTSTYRKKDSTGVLTRCTILLHVHPPQSPPPRNTAPRARCRPTTRGHNQPQPPTQLPCPHRRANRRSGCTRKPKPGIHRQRHNRSRRPSSRRGIRKG